MSVEQPKVQNPLSALLEKLFSKLAPNMELGAEVKAEITVPTEESVVPFRIACEGTWSNIPEKADLWLVVLVAQLIPGTEDKLDIFYPQGSALLRLPGGSWNTAVSVGYDERSSRGNSHELLLVLTRGGTSRQLGKYAHEAISRGKWSGMMKLPPGSIIMDSVTVIRD